MVLRRFTVLALTLIILLADSGQTIYAHTCNKTKQTHVSLGQPKHCCAKKVTNTCGIKKSSCCEVSSKLLKQGFVNKPVSVNEFESAAGQVVRLFELFQVYLAQTECLTAGNTSPPIAYEKSRCTFTQTFRI
jgi:hypothetical protein